MINCKECLYYRFINEKNVHLCVRNEKAKPIDEKDTNKGCLFAKRGDYHTVDYWNYH